MEKDLFVQRLLQNNLICTLAGYHGMIFLAMFQHQPSTRLYKQWSEILRELEERGGGRIIREFRLDILRRFWDSDSFAAVISGRVLDSGWINLLELEVT